MRHWILMILALVVGTAQADYLVTETRTFDTVDPYGYGSYQDAMLDVAPDGRIHLLYQFYFWGGDWFDVATRYWAGTTDNVELVDMQVAPGYMEGMSRFHNGDMLVTTTGSVEVYDGWYREFPVISRYNPAAPTPRLWQQAPHPDNAFTYSSSAALVLPDYDGERILLPVGYEEISMLDSRTGLCVDWIDPESGDVEDVAFDLHNPHGGRESKLSAAAADGTVLLHSDGQLSKLRDTIRWTTDVTVDEVTALTATANGGALVGGLHGDVVWYAANGSVLTPFDVADHGMTVLRGIAERPDGRFVMVGAENEDDPHLTVLEMNSDGSEIDVQILENVPGIATDVAVLSDGRLVLSAIDSGLALLIWLAPETAVDPADTRIHPAEFTLAPVYPNPFNGTARTTMFLPAPSDVTVTLLNLLGQPVRTVERGPMPAGMHTFTIDGSGLSSGSYLLHATGEFGATARRITLVK